jgi:hypothetical protein
MYILDKAYLMGMSLSESDLESWLNKLSLDKLSDEDLNQIIESMPPEVFILCLCGLFLYSLAFGYRVGRNYKR